MHKRCSCNDTNSRNLEADVGIIFYFLKFLRNYITRRISNFIATLIQSKKSIGKKLNSIVHNGKLIH